MGVQITGTVYVKMRFVYSAWLKFFLLKILLMLYRHKMDNLLRNFYFFTEMMTLNIGITTTSNDYENNLKELYTAKFVK